MVMIFFNIARVAAVLYLGYQGVAITQQVASSVSRLVAGAGIVVLVAICAKLIIWIFPSKRKKR